MKALLDRTVSDTRLIGSLALLNGVAVSSLYWGQSVVGRAAVEFGPSLAVGLMPGATLAGYALGVAGLATIAGDLTEPRALFGHCLLLVAALCAAASAPTAPVLCGACLLVGAGCALTQRVLATATSAVAPEWQAPVIGWVIATGLCGIVVARSCVPAASGALGWRGVFWLDALLACITGLAATSVTARVFRGAGAIRPELPGADMLWREHAVLRRAALQQAAVFAAFNMGWAIFPRVLLPLAGRSAPTMAVVALLGASAALASGRLCRTLGSRRVAAAGALLVAGAVATLALAPRHPPEWIVGMTMLDVGTQIALVANQARAQALATSPAMRGRLAAILTTIGFIGGAIGSATGNLLAVSP